MSYVLHFILFYLKILNSQELSQCSDLSQNSNIVLETSLSQPFFILT